MKSKRACVIDYQESQLAAQQVAPPEVKGPKLPKKPSYNAWQFFDTQRLEEIWELECKYTIQQHERKMEEKRLMKEKKQYEELMARRRKAEAANNVVKVDEEAGADARAASPKSEPPPVSPTSAKREASPASPTSATVKAEAAEANRPGAAAPAESSMEVARPHPLEPQRLFDCWSGCLSPKGQRPPSPKPGFGPADQVPGLWPLWYT